MTCSLCNGYRYADEPSDDGQQYGQYDDGGSTWAGGADSSPAQLSAGGAGVYSGGPMQAVGSARPAPVPTFSDDSDYAAAAQRSSANDRTAADDAAFVVASGAEYSSPTDRNPNGARTAQLQYKSPSRDPSEMMTRAYDDPIEQQRMPGNDGAYAAAAGGEDDAPPGEVQGEGEGQGGGAEERYSSADERYSSAEERYSSPEHDDEDESDEEWAGSGAGGGLAGAADAPSPGGTWGAPPQKPSEQYALDRDDPDIYAAAVDNSELDPFAVGSGMASSGFIPSFN